jgi:vacuolar protein-sorting-associated protein 4
MSLPSPSLHSNIVDEKNEKSKQMIKKKVGEYLERAEKLKDHLSKPTTKDGKPTSAAANGVGAGGKGKCFSLYQDQLMCRPDEEIDADTAKLRGALSGAILSETPNVKWEDVAGLEGAKETLKEAVILPIKVHLLKDHG